MLKSKTQRIIAACKLPEFSSFSEMGSLHLEEGSWGGGAADGTLAPLEHCEHGSTWLGSGR